MQREHLHGVRPGHKLDGHLIQRAVTDDECNTASCVPRRRHVLTLNIYCRRAEVVRAAPAPANSSQNILNNLIMCVSYVVPTVSIPKLPVNHSVNVVDDTHRYNRTIIYSITKEIALRTYLNIITYCK